MFSSGDYLSETEKLDRVYRMLRNQERSRRFGLFLKLAAIGAIAYGYYFIGLPENAHLKTEIKDAVQSRITELVVPMVNDMVQGMAGGMAPSLSTGTSGTVRHRNVSGQNTVSAPTITPEMIQAVQEAMKKK